MEVTITDHHNFAEGSILSVRFGSTRRQAPLESVKSHPLKFPCRLEACAEPLKIDVFQPTATSRLVLHSHDEDYVLGMETNDGRNLSLGLKARNLEGALADSAQLGSSRRSPDGAGLLGRMKADETTASATAARDYLDTTGLLRYVQALLHAVIQVKPDDPFGFMMVQLGAARSRSSMLASQTVSPKAFSDKPLIREPQEKPPKKVQDEDAKSEDTVKESAPRKSREPEPSDTSDKPPVTTEVTLVPEGQTRGSSVPAAPMPKEVMPLLPDTPPPAMAAELDQTPAPVEKAVRPETMAPVEGHEKAMLHLPMPPAAAGLEVKGPERDLAAATPQASEVETAAAPFGPALEADALNVPSAVPSAVPGAADESEAAAQPAQTRAKTMTELRDRCMVELQRASSDGRLNAAFARASRHRQESDAEQLADDLAAEPQPAALRATTTAIAESRAKSMEEVRAMAFRELERSSSDGRLTAAFARLNRRRQESDAGQPAAQPIDGEAEAPSAEQPTDGLAEQPIYEFAEQPAALRATTTAMAESRAKSMEEVRAMAFRELERSSSDGRLTAAFARMNRRREVVPNNEARPDEKTARATIVEAPMPEPDEDIRALAFRTLARGTTLGRLGESRPGIHHLREEKEKTSLCQDALNLLKGGSASGKLGDALQHVADVRAAKEEEDLRALTAQSFEESLKPDKADAIKAVANSFKESQDYALRRLYKDTLVAASTSGQLNDLLNGPLSKKTEKDVGAAGALAGEQEDLRHMVHATLATNATSGKLGTTLVGVRQTVAEQELQDLVHDTLASSNMSGKPDEQLEERELRRLAHRTLSENSTNGRLALSLERARTGQGVKALAFHTFGAAATSGDLEKALRRVISDRSLSALAATRAAVPRRVAPATPAPLAALAAPAAEAPQEPARGAGPPPMAPPLAPASSAGVSEARKARALKPPGAPTSDTGSKTSVATKSSGASHIREKLQAQLTGAYFSGQLEREVAATMETPTPADAGDLKKTVRDTLKSAMSSGMLDECLNQAAAARQAPQGGRCAKPADGREVMEEGGAPGGADTDSEDGRDVEEDEEVCIGGARGQVLTRTTTDLLVRNLESGAEEWHAVEDVKPADGRHVKEEDMVRAGQSRGQVLCRTTTDLLVKKDDGSEQWFGVEDVRPVARAAVAGQPVPDMQLGDVDCSEVELPRAVTAYLTPRIGAQPSSGAARPAGAAADTAAGMAAPPAPMSASEMRELYSTIVSMANQIATLTKEMSEMRKEKHQLVEFIKRGSTTPSLSSTIQRP